MMRNGFPWWFIALFVIGIIIGVFEFAAVMGSDLSPLAKYLILTR